ncbi:MAG TPA: hypothetical protein DGT23_03415 [Micromonosporaceae bacterium]|nr:hypothetical protein [Micromonosporaceae bacterium]
MGTLADPRRLDQLKIPRSHSEAEHDPHAFLYWPATKLLVVPVNQEALLVRVEDSKLTELSRIDHDGAPIRRSLVIGDTLWTISHEAAMASTLDGTQLALLKL